MYIDTNGLIWRYVKRQEIILRKDTFRYQFHMRVFFCEFREKMRKQQIFTSINKVAMAV